MKFQNKKTINIVLEALFSTYCERVPDVKKITNAMVLKNIVSNQSEIINDHIAFRTMGVENLGIKSFEKNFLHHGYKKKDYYFFKGKKLNAFWYSHPGKNMPRIFISELIVDDLSENSQKIINAFSASVPKKNQAAYSRWFGKGSARLKHFGQRFQEGNKGYVNHGLALWPGLAQPGLAQAFPSKGLRA